MSISFLHKTYIFLVLLLVCWSESAVAQPFYQDFPTEKLNVEHGLVNNHINWILQDKTGYMWIGTNEGLNRFDGIDFTLYASNPDIVSSLSSNTVLCLLNDLDNQIWVGTSYGLNRLVKGTYEFVRYFDQSVAGTTPGFNQISAIHQSDDSTIWIGGGDGTLYAYIPEKDTFEAYPAPGMAEIRTIVDGPDGQIILGYGAWVLEKQGGIRYFDTKNRTYISSALTDQSTDLSVTRLISQNDDSLWIASYNKGLTLYEPKISRTSTFRASENKNRFNSDLIYDIQIDGQNILWAHTDGGGINWMDLNSGSIDQYHPPKDQEGFFASTYLYEDQLGVFWVGSIGSGILKFDRYRSKIDNYEYEKGNTTGLSGQSVLGLEESSDGLIWIGLDRGGINSLNPVNNTLQHFKVGKKGDPKSLGSGVINGIYELSDGRLVIGSFLDGFDIYDRDKERFTHFNGESALKGATYIKCFFEDEYNVLWIGSRKQGLIRYDLKNKAVSNFKHSPDITGLNNNHVSAILPENDENLWIGTFNGLNLFNTRTNTFKSWKHDKSDSTSLIGIEVYALGKDQNGGIWVGTDHGLSYYDRLSDSFKNFTVADGLPSNAIKGILCDENNHLWISTNRGVSRLDIANLTFKNFSREDGFAGVSYGENAALKTADGKMYFGSTNGLSAFYPGNIHSNDIAPKLSFTDLTISNDQMLPGEEGSPLERPIYETERLVLTHEQNAFGVHFAAFNFTSSSKNQYAYKLEGFDQNWNYVNDKRSADYTNINSGLYTLHVKASNNDGVWNQEGIKIEIEILPPWWKTNWAFVGYVFIFFIAAVVGRNAGMARLKLINELKMERLSKEKEHEINQAKLKLYTNISHEFKTPLTLILGPLEKLLSIESENPEKKKQLRIIQRNSNRLLKLINQLMEFRKIDSGNMRLQAQPTEIVSFISEIVENFTPIALDKRISLTLDTEIKSLILWVDHDKIDKIFYNLISNALNNSDEGDQVKVLIDVPTGESILEEKVVIQVADTGHGISAEEQEKIFERFYRGGNKQGSGIGLAFSKSLAQLHHGDLTVQSEVGKGSTFTITIPIGKDHFSDSEIVKKSKSTHALPIVQEAPQPQEPEVVSDKKHDNTLLVVDDDSDIRVFISDHYSGQYNIICAEDGAEGLEKALAHHPDLIISDLMMPVMDGVAFCEKIKNDIHTSHIPFVLLTAKSAEEKVVEGFHTGADDYITKPFSIKLLDARISNLIESRSKLRTRFQNEITIESSQVTMSKLDEKFLNTAIKAVEENMSDPEFSIEFLLRELGTSRSHFFRKIKSLTGQSPNDFIHTIRFKMAGKLLLESGMNITEISHKIGYATTKNFRTGFKKHFNQTPTEFINTYRKKHEQASD